MVSPVLDLNNEVIKQLIYVKTNVGGWFFDAFLRMDHTSKLKITEHPVQTGAAITDHAFLEPTTLTMEIGMTDVAKSIIPDQFTGGWSRSVTAYQVLLELQRQRIPVQILTRLRLYKNMLIEVISVPDDYKTLYGLKVTVAFKEILVAQVTTVKISQRPQVTDSTNRGVVEPVESNKSILKDLGDKLFGGTNN
jgi:hypothetical protein